MARASIAVLCGAMRTVSAARWAPPLIDNATINIDSIQTLPGPGTFSDFLSLVTPRIQSVAGPGSQQLVRPDPVAFCPSWLAQLVSGDHYSAHRNSPRTWHKTKGRVS